MSQYTEFYVANAGSNEFVEIGCYGRSSKISEIFSWYAPWEKIKRITKEVIFKVREDCSNLINEYKKRIDEYEERKHLIAEMNNSIEEKTEWLDDLDESQKEVLTEIEDIEFAKNFLWFLNDMVESGIEVYCGIECGKVSREDIE